MHVAYKEGGRFQYCCNLQSQYAKANCQNLSGRPIDEAVVQEFFHFTSNLPRSMLWNASAVSKRHHKNWFGICNRRSLAWNMRLDVPNDSTTTSIRRID